MLINYGHKRLYNIGPWLHSSPMSKFAYHSSAGGFGLRSPARSGRSNSGGLADGDGLALGSGQELQDVWR